MRLRILASVLALATVIVGGLTVFDAGGQSLKVASDGDPNRVTMSELREEIARSGLNVRFVRLPGSTVAVIAGVASRGGAAMGFEFQVFSSSDVATVRRLGHLRPADFGWRPARFDPLYRTWIRGVLGNVAYAQYEAESDQQLLADRARRQIVRALDDALFRAFPRDDPYIHPQLSADEL